MDVGLAGGASGLAKRRRFSFPRTLGKRSWLAGNVGGGRNQELAVGRPVGQSGPRGPAALASLSSGLQGAAVEAAPGPFAAMPRAAKGWSGRKEEDVNN